MIAGRRVAWFNCFSGISGDMTLGSLVDAGADTDELVKLLGQIPIGGWSLEFEPVLRHGLAATQAIVSALDDGVVRTFMHVLGIVEEARLPDRVRARAVAAFSVLAEVEGRLHRRPVAQVHFHEVGGHDAIVDVVGSAIALELLEVDIVASSPVVNGTGVVRTSHGLLPNPAPAVVELLAGIPTVGRDVNVELTTPTGAAMLRAWGSHFGPMPAMTIERSGFGAGARELEGTPNCTQVVIGTTASEGSVGPSGQPLVVLESNVDDATGETLAHAVTRLLEEGALDAWLHPVVMKGGRPGHVLSVLCDPALASELSGVMAAQTGTLGVRASAVQRWTSEREQGVAEVQGLPVRVKVSPGRVKAEHSDAARVARITGLTLLEVAARAEAGFRSSLPETDGDDDLSPPPPGA
ncbi:MAG TPA: nickel pincer cofactor biosynthesis protein LarC [Acidimicrobiales bacterium]|nr:nickel pincer cofactor biosynthesis protein LarC [Acidimicrobiales bacterium]